MKKEKLTLQAVDSINHTKVQLPPQFVVLSEKELQQIVGGFATSTPGYIRIGGR
jgi:bacteriocin-like protein